MEMMTMSVPSHTEKTLKKGPAHRPVLDPKTGSKIGQRATQNWNPFWTHFLSNFGIVFGGFWVPSGPQDWPGRGLEEPVELRKAKKTTIKKVVFA